MRAVASAFERLRFNGSPEITAVMYSCLLNEGFVSQRAAVIKPRSYLPIVAPWDLEETAVLAGA